MTISRSDCPACYWLEHGEKMPLDTDAAICCDEHCEDDYQRLLQREYDEIEAELGPPPSLVEVVW